MIKLPLGALRSFHVAQLSFLIVQYVLVQQSQLIILAGLPRAFRRVMLAALVCAMKLAPQLRAKPSTGVATLSVPLWPAAVWVAPVSAACVPTMPPTRPALHPL